MTTINFTLLKITKFALQALLLFNLACSSTKPDGKDKMAASIDDFIATYKSHNFENALRVIMISTKLKNDKVEYIINDAPINSFYGELNKVSNESGVYVGKYKNIFCQIKSDSLPKYKHLFENLDESVFQSAKDSQLVKGNDGKSYNIDLSLANWNPELIIVYNISDGTKKTIVDKKNDD